MHATPARLPLAALLVAAALAGSLPAAAEDNPDTVYNVEIIVFRAAATEGVPENWSDEAGARSIAGDESASGSQQVGRFVALLAPSAYQLGGLEERLRTSGSYVPVAHVAWSQTASAWGTRAGFPLSRLGVDVPGLTGNVFLERGQFLHLGLSLSWTMAAPPAGLGAAAGTTFTMNETRRVRFYERNYYDHPAFGVLALVTPAQGARAPGR
jgi:Peptidoglycan-binding protein, CsiV